MGLAGLQKLFKFLRHNSKLYAASDQKNATNDKYLGKAKMHRWPPRNGMHPIF